MSLYSALSLNSVFTHYMETWVVCLQNSCLYIVHCLYIVRQSPKTFSHLKPPLLRLEYLNNTIIIAKLKARNRYSGSQIKYSTPPYYAPLYYADPPLT